MSIYTAGGPNSQFEAAASKALADVRARMAKIQREIVEILMAAISRPVRAGSYWAGVERQLAKKYNEITRIYWGHASQEIPRSYALSLADVNRRIGKVKKITETARRTVRQLANSQASMQITQALVTDAVAAMDAATASGYRNARRITRMTQQAIIEEWTIDSAVAEAFARGDLVGEFQKTLAARDQSYARMLESFRGERVIQAGSKTFTPEYYAEMVSRTKFHEAQAHAAMQQAKNYGTDLVLVSNHNTRTEMCQYYEAKTFSMSGKDLRFPVLDQAPPFHPNCYLEGTLVLTSEGWKDFRDIRGDELILSLDLDTKTTQWTRIVKKITDIVPEVLEFSNRNITAIVTPGHKMVMTSDWGRKNGEELGLLDAGDAFKKQSGSFYASSEWVGEAIDPDYCEFMAWYLSDGSTYKKSERSHQVVISQSREKSPDTYNEIVSCLKRFTDKNLCQRADGIVFYDEILGKRLQLLGLHAEEKWIPDDIMEASREDIRLFLDTFVKADGHRRPGKVFKGSRFLPSNSYFTSSERMAGQLCELILKVGGRPSVKKVPPKKVKFKNGEYQCKPVFIINEGHNRWHSMQNMTKKKHTGEFAVYCLELEENHTMLVSYDYHGVMWSGNCLHLLYPVFESAMMIDGTLDAQSAFSMGRVDRPPVPAGYVPIADRG